MDCQWACPAHTPVPEYIRLIAHGPLLRRLHDQLAVERVPGNPRAHLRPSLRAGLPARARRGRAGGDLPPEARRRRLQRRHQARGCPSPRRRRTASASRWSAADRPRSPWRATSPRSAITCVVFDGDPKAGGMIRTQIPKFRLPDSVIDEECGYILDLGVEFRGGKRIDSMKALLAEGWDAIFVGSGAPRGRDLDIPGRKEAAKNIHIGIDWLSSVSFGHVSKIGKRVIVLGGGNTAMDCCRSARRLGGEQVRRGGALGLRGNEGVALGKGRRHARGHPDPQLPRAEGIHARQRQAHRHHLREGEGRVRRQGPPQAGARRRAATSISPATTCWWRSARRTPSPGSSAMPASSSTNGACPSSTTTTFQSTQPEGLLRRRRGLRPEEHHLGGGAWPRGRGLDRQDAQWRGHRRPPAAGGRADEPEDGHPRMVLRQRDRAR